MKNLHTIILSLMVYMALVPASMQANSLTRVLAHKVSKQTAMQLVKNPAVIALGLGAASAVCAKYNANKAQALDERNRSGRQPFIDGADSYRNLELTARYASNLLLGFSANYLAMQQLRKFGYLPKLASHKKRIVLGLIPVIACLTDKPVNLWFFRKYDDLDDFANLTRWQEIKLNIMYACYSSVQPFATLEAIVGPLTYLAFFA